VREIERNRQDEERDPEGGLADARIHDAGERKRENNDTEGVEGSLLVDGIDDVWSQHECAGFALAVANPGA